MGGEGRGGGRGGNKGKEARSLPTNEDSSSGWLLWVDNSRSELVIPNETRDSLLDYFCGETEKEKEEGKGRDPTRIYITERQAINLTRQVRGTSDTVEGPLNIAKEVSMATALCVSLHGPSAGGTEQQEKQILNCLLAKQLCEEDSNCSAILKVIPTLCGPELGESPCVLPFLSSPFPHYNSIIPISRPTPPLRRPYTTLRRIKPRHGKRARPTTRLLARSPTT
ncbi:hypothetical protein O3P69_000233 [Scylla paramamosain]|uniref:Uncharacterized protein n=1 Tax=Scylla paramamosain TaxID=85552 RepID=A0AAW0UVT3_SCYPA